MIRSLVLAAIEERDESPIVRLVDFAGQRMIVALGTFNTDTKQTGGHRFGDLLVAVTPLVVDRTSDRLAQPIPADAIRDLQAELEASPALADAPRPLVVLVSGDDRYIQVGDTIGVRLEVDGERIVFPPSSAG